MFGYVDVIEHVVIMHHCSILFKNICIDNTSVFPVGMMKLPPTSVAMIQNFLGPHLELLIPYF